jgi:hypothetical protein
VRVRAFKARLTYCFRVGFHLLTPVHPDRSGPALNVPDPHHLLDWEENKEGKEKKCHSDPRRSEIVGERWRKSMATAILVVLVTWRRRRRRDRCG